MHEAAASGEWISLWLSPVAQFLFDVAFAVAVLAATGLLLKVVRRARPKNPRPAP